MDTKLTTMNWKREMSNRTKMVYVVWGGDVDAPASRVMGADFVLIWAGTVSIYTNRSRQGFGTDLD